MSGSPVAIQNMSQKCFQVLVSLGALRAAYFPQSSKVVDLLEETRLVDVVYKEPTVYTDASTVEVTITSKGKRVLRRFTADYLARVLIDWDYSDVAGTVWYVSEIGTVAALAEFLVHSDRLIREVAKRRLDELIGRVFLVQLRRVPIRTVTMLNPDKRLSVIST